MTKSGGNIKCILLHSEPPRHCFCAVESNFTSRPGVGIPPNHNLAPQINGVELIQVHTPFDWSWSKQIFSVVVGKLVHCKGRTIIFLFGIYFLILIQIMLRISFEVYVL